MNAGTVTPKENVFESFIAQLRGAGTREAYTRDITAFGSWETVGLSPSAAVSALLLMQVTPANELVRQWLRALEAKGVKRSRRVRCLAAMRALTRYAQSIGACPWNIYLKGAAA